MSELTVTILRLGLLVLLWVFVFSVVGVLRGDLYGTRVARRPAPASGRSKRHATPRPAQRPAPMGAPREQRGRGRAARGSGMPSNLVVTSGPLAGTKLSLRESGTLIGRSPESALVLDDDFASGRHARIYRDDQGWWVEDLGSTNGTFLGEEKVVRPVPVEVGSVVRVGRTVIELRK